MAFNPKTCVLGNRLGYCLEDDCRYYSRAHKRYQYRERERADLAALGVRPDKHEDNRR